MILFKLWIHNDYLVVKMLVWNVRIKAFWYTKIYKTILILQNFVIELIGDFMSNSEILFHSGLVCSGRSLITRAKTSIDT